MRAEEVGGRGRQDEADREPGRERERDAGDGRERRGEQDFGNDRGQRRAEEGGVEVGAERFAAEPCVERDAGDDRPDVEQVLAEEPKAQHQEETGDRRARHRRTGAPVDERRREREQPGADAPAANAADAEIVGEQRIPRGENRAEAAENFGRRLDDQAERHEGCGVSRDDAEDEAVGHGSRLALIGRNRHAVSSVAILAEIFVARLAGLRKGGSDRAIEPDRSARGCRRPW